MSQNPYVNLSAYRFVQLSDTQIQAWRPEFLKFFAELELKGTFVLSPEGINIAAAGGSEQVDKLSVFLDQFPELKGIEFKKSLSAQQPFNRLLVKIKENLVPVGRQIQLPSCVGDAQQLSPEELCQWLDEARDFVLLDVRNRYETRLGKFSKAIEFDLKHFRYFPEKVSELKALACDRPVVMYCTGGIRCEKAGPLVGELGVKNVYQLEGGILSYFEKCGGKHYDGLCFVFDNRVAIDPDLQETDLEQCFQCREPLTAQEQSDPAYEPGISCPYCIHQT